MSRPQTLAEVSVIARDDPAGFAMALDEFIDEFYLDHPDKQVQQGRIHAVPDIVGDPFVDAWIGAAGEHLAQRWGLQVPTWTLRAEHSALQEPRFVPDSRALKGVFLVESPPAFRSRLLFTGLEPFERARFPLDMPRARTALEWPKREPKAEPAGALQPQPK
jgi:hypothetical protein